MTQTTEQLKNVFLADHYHLHREAGRGSMPTGSTSDDRRHDGELALEVLHLVAVR